MAVQNDSVIVGSSTASSTTCMDEADDDLTLQSAEFISPKNIQYA